MEVNSMEVKVIKERKGYKKELPPNIVEDSKDYFTCIKFSEKLTPYEAYIVQYCCNKLMRMKDVSLKRVIAYVSHK